MKQPALNGDGNSCLSVRLLCRGTSAAALKRLGENVLCLRLLGHDRPGELVRLDCVGTADLIGSRTSGGFGPLEGPADPRKGP